MVVDKPFVTTVADGERLIERAARVNRVVAVFHNRRADFDFLTVKTPFVAAGWGISSTSNRTWTAGGRIPVPTDGKSNPSPVPGCSTIWARI